MVIRNKWALGVLTAGVLAVMPRPAAAQIGFPVLPTQPFAQYNPALLLSPGYAQAQYLYNLQAMQVLQARQAAALATLYPGMQYPGAGMGIGGMGMGGFTPQASSFGDPYGGSMAGGGW